MLLTRRFLQNLIFALGVTATLIFDVTYNLFYFSLIIHFISRMYPSSLARSGYWALEELQER